uniref:CUE domain containing 1a n=1 Tax=Oncorhynchus kisutch TaxID=8019 RepID=A0A8C7KP98_ONCKI
MMTSLFRRHSNSSGNHGDVAPHEESPAPGELNNSRPGGSGRTVRRLEFNQAMEDFRTMFPSMEQEVIECVLRANHGAVDSTIDQLLQMSLDGHGSIDSSDSEDSLPPEILERTLEPDSSDEEPLPVYSPPSYDMHIYDRKYPDEVLPTASPPPSFDASQTPPCQPPPCPPPPASQWQVGSYRNWNPPLLGNLPDDFLRILPQQLDSLPCSYTSLMQSSLTQPSSSSSLSSMTQQVQPGAGARAGQNGMETEQERKLKQYLGDERIALFLQNEEFMRELQRNREFLIALERGVHTRPSTHSLIHPHTDYFLQCFQMSSTVLSDDITMLSSQSRYEESLEGSLCHGRAFLLIFTTSVLVMHEGRLAGCPAKWLYAHNHIDAETSALSVLDRLQYESKTSKSHHSTAFMGMSTPGDNCASGSGEACTDVTDDALFRDKLKHMGKSTRKKLFEVARAFSEKTRRRKTKRRALLKHHSLGNAASTANLLDDEDAGHLSEKDNQLKRPGPQEEEVPQQEVLS